MSALFNFKSFLQGERGHGWPGRWRRARAVLDARGQCVRSRCHSSGFPQSSCSSSAQARTSSCVSPPSSSEATGSPESSGRRRGLGRGSRRQARSEPRVALARERRAPVRIQHRPLLRPSDAPPPPGRCACPIPHSLSCRAVGGARLHRYGSVHALLVDVDASAFPSPDRGAHAPRVAWQFPCLLRKPMPPRAARRTRRQALQAPRLLPLPPRAGAFASSVRRSLARCARAVTGTRTASWRPSRGSARRSWWRSGSCCSRAWPRRGRRRRSPALGAPSPRLRIQDASPAAPGGAHPGALARPRSTLAGAWRSLRR